MVLIFTSFPSAVFSFVFDFVLSVLLVPAPDVLLLVELLSIVPVPDVPLPDASLLVVELTVPEVVLDVVLLVPLVELESVLLEELFPLPKPELELVLFSVPALPVFPVVSDLPDVLDESLPILLEELLPHFPLDVSVVEVLVLAFVFGPVVSTPLSKVPVPTLLEVVLVVGSVVLVIVPVLLLDDELLAALAEVEL